MRTRDEESLQTPIASLIDVVFLLIIFFVVTASVEKEVVDETIRLAQAKHVPALKRKDSRTVTINLHEDGTINIGLQSLTFTQLSRILTATVAKSGNTVPVVIRSDSETLFHEVDKVMKVVGEAGLYRVKISAVAVD